MIDFFALTVNGCHKKVGASFVVLSCWYTQDDGSWSVTFSIRFWAKFKLEIWKFHHLKRRPNHEKSFRLSDCSVTVMKTHTPLVLRTRERRHRKISSIDYSPWLPYHSIIQYHLYLIVELLALPKLTVIWFHHEPFRLATMAPARVTFGLLSLSTTTVTITDQNECWGCWLFTNTIV